MAAKQIQFIHDGVHLKWNVRQSLGRRCHFLTNGSPAPFILLKLDRLSLATAGPNVRSKNRLRKSNFCTNSSSSSSDEPEEFSETSDEVGKLANTLIDRAGSPPRENSICVKSIISNNNNNNNNKSNIKINQSKVHAMLKLTLPATAKKAVQHFVVETRGWRPAHLNVKRY